MIWSLLVFGGEGFGVGQNTIALVAVLGAIPFLLIAITSFVKIAVVLSLIRQALGVQQIPPNIVIYSIAIILTAFVMFPTGLEVGEIVVNGLQEGERLRDIFRLVATPISDFISQHIIPAQQKFFNDTAFRLWGDDALRLQEEARSNSSVQLVLQMPAFMVSELTRGFQIGFLIYLPFIVVDLIVANILLALGMVTMSPITISLPVKLLLFIGLDGWQRLMEALVLSYA